MTKAEYLAAAAEWKAEYAEHTTKSRADKRTYKEAQRAFAKCGSYDWKSNSSNESNKAYLLAERVMQSAMSQCGANKAKATEMINDRIAMKEEAGRAMMLDREARK